MLLEVSLFDVVGFDSEMVPNVFFNTRRRGLLLRDECGEMDFGEIEFGMELVGVVGGLLDTYGLVNVFGDIVDVVCVVSVVGVVFLVLFVIFVGVMAMDDMGFLGNKAQS